MKKIGMQRTGKMELTGSGQDPATFLPESYDYRKAGLGTAVKNQGVLERAGRLHR